MMPVNIQFSLCSGRAVRCRSSPSCSIAVDAQADRLADGRDAELAEREPVAAQQGGGEVDRELVGEAGRDDRARQGRAALHVDAAECRGCRGRRGSPRGRGCASRSGRPDACAAPRHPGSARSPTTTGTGWWGISSPASPRAVRVGSSASTVPVPTRIASLASRSSCTRWRAAVPVIHWLLPSDAAARPSSVDAHLTVTHGRPARDRGQPLMQERLRLVGEHPAEHLDAAGAQVVGAAARALPRVAECVDDARDSGVQQGDRARARAAGVVAGLEGDDGGQARGIRSPVCRRGQLRERVDLGVRRAGAVVPALGDDARPSASTSTQPTCGLPPVIGPCAASSSARRMKGSHCCGVPFAVRRSSGPQVSLRDGSGVCRAWHHFRLSPRARRKCVLPPIRTLTVGPGIPPDRPLSTIERSSRTITAGSDFHRPRSTCFVTHTTTRGCRGYSRGSGASSGMRGCMPPAMTSILDWCKPDNVGESAEPALLAGSTTPILRRSTAGLTPEQPGHLTQAPDDGHPRRARRVELLVRRPARAVEPHPEEPGGGGAQRVRREPVADVRGLAGCDAEDVAGVGEDRGIRFRDAERPARDHVLDARQQTGRDAVSRSAPRGRRW